MRFSVFICKFINQYEKCEGEGLLNMMSFEMLLLI